MKRLSFLKALVLAPFIGAVNTVKASSPKKNFVWTEEHIRAGLYIVTDREFDIDKRPGYVMTLSAQIGYSFCNRDINDDCGYRINSISDGWSHGIVDKSRPKNYTRKELVDYLNGKRFVQSGYLTKEGNIKGDKWRPLTKEELRKIIDYCTKNFIE